MRSHGLKATLLLIATLLMSCWQQAGAADLGRSIIPQLQERFGLTEAQVRGSLGALLIFVRERVPKSQFDGLLKNIPDADFIMRDTRVRGIVKMPLDDIEDFQASLASLGLPADRRTIRAGGCRISRSRGIHRGTEHARWGAGLTIQPRRPNGDAFLTTSGARHPTL